MSAKKFLSVWLLLPVMGGACAASDGSVEITWGGEKAVIDTERPMPVVKLPKKLKQVIVDKFRGYRLPSRKDYKLDWVEFYEFNKVPFLALGDFNHDGRQDIAARLKSEQKDDVWKLVIFHGTGSSFEPVVLLTSPDSTAESRNYGPIQRYGMKTTTGCDNPPCLASYVYESASFVYVWAGKGYKEINTSD